MTLHFHPTRHIRTLRLALAPVLTVARVIEPSVPVVTRTLPLPIAASIAV